MKRTWQSNDVRGSGFLVAFVFVFLVQSSGVAFDDPPTHLLERYCFDCHDSGTREAGLDLETLVSTEGIDGSLVFENLITGRMPPVDADHPSAKEKHQILAWLATRQHEPTLNPRRRISRREFNFQVADLLGVDLDLIDSIPDDTDTYDFESDRRIQLTREMLSSYFSAADQMLEEALPTRGFLPEMTWDTNALRESHPTYEIYHRSYKDGTLFSWTRANNGNGYSFFYDHFDPPISGWYELTFDAAKVGAFDEDVTVQVYAGKYYFADDRPQPQRLLGVISLGKNELESHTVRGFLHPGESVSVHCYSRHTWRQKDPVHGAYIKNLQVRGPLTDGWPPRSYRQVFTGVPLKSSPRGKVTMSTRDSVLERIGGAITVSSFQDGMEKEHMLDGLKKTFWHTRFDPKLAKPPHFVILQNPAAVEIRGLKYSTWSGGNGNGQVKAYEVYVSKDGQSWNAPIVCGKLETQSSADQSVHFATPTKAPFIKFLITDSFSIDGRSLASIGELDVIADVAETDDRFQVTVEGATADKLEQVIRRFAERAFSTSLSDDELTPYVGVSTESLRANGDFVEAAKIGMKAVICSPRFLLTPGIHQNESYRVANDVARTLWLSVPDEKLLKVAGKDLLRDSVLRAEIDRMLADERSIRMVRSFADQWLDLRSFQKVAPSLKLYPQYDDLLDHYLPLETERYLHFLILENQPVSHLIDSHYSFLNQRLAQHYGVDDVFGQKLRRVRFAEDSPRGGLLTMGSILKVTSDGFETSPILRGAWISRNVAGNTLSPPPENVKAIESDTSGATTLREKIAQHKNQENCAACHRSIDPYGFALESFDATGGWRSTYRQKLPHQGTFQYRREGYFKQGEPVDTGGEIDGETFQDIKGLKQILLANHRKIAYNFMKKFFEYANGHKPTLAQRLKLFQNIPQRSADCRIRDLVAEVLVQSFEAKSE